jgi:hypothetical protein
MQVIVIMRHPSTVVAVIEKPDGLLTQVAILVWAKSLGYEKVPTDLHWQVCNFTPFSMVLLSLMPCSVMEALKSNS